MKAAAEPARAVSQGAITAEIARIAADYQGKDEPQPLLDYPPYRSSRLRHPTPGFVVAGSQRNELLTGLQAIAELTGKALSGNYFGAIDAVIDATLDRAGRVVKEHP